MQRCALENFAADENLGPDHWFWDKNISGGIFVEHGVHFFDLFNWQLNQRPEQIVALAVPREDGPVDTVQAVVRYAGGATASCYHAFTRANAAEHQGLTFGWQWATAEVHGWIPLDLIIEGLVDQAGLAVLHELLDEGLHLLQIPGEPALPQAALDFQVLESYTADRIMRGGESTRHVTARVRLHATLGDSDAKSMMYEQCVRAGMADLVGVIRGRGAAGITPPALWASTAVAVAARAAIQGSIVQVVPPPRWLTK
jgi:hypothetical protein